MGDETGSPPRSWQQMDAEMQNQSSGSHESFLDSAQEPYPDYDFSPDVKIYSDSSGAVLAPRPYETKLGYTLRLLPDVAGEEFTLFGKREFITKQLTVTRKFLETEITVQDKKVTRANVIDQKDAMLTTLSEMAAVNHPALQLLTKLEQLRVPKDDEGNALEELFSLATLEQLFTDVITVTAWQTLRAAYNRQIKQARQPSEDLVQ